MLCLDCQRHEIYNQQYRAMFVLNCSVDRTQKLKYSLSKSARRKGGGKGKGSKGSNEAKDDDDSEDYNPVKCETCSTEVAVFDKDEVYHFFNVIASYT